MVHDEKNDLGAQSATEDVSAGSIAPDAASHAAPTLAEIEAAMIQSDAACFHLLAKFRRLIKSGDCVLISTRARNAHEASAIRLLKIGSVSVVEGEASGIAGQERVAQKSSSSDSDRKS